MKSRIKSYVLGILMILLFIPFVSAGQELFCTVSVDATQVSGDKQPIQQMKDAFTRFMNLTKWTNDQFAPEERIKCFMNISITAREDNHYSAFVNIRVVRPAFNSTYETVLCNLSDKNFDFNYLPFQELQYNDGTYIDNITALLSFYAYIILGFDYDSYSQNGGQNYFLKAQEIVNLSSASPEVGWTLRSSANPTNTRFALADNYVNGSYKVMHSVAYKYHRLGLDKMESDPVNARKAILEALTDVKQLNASTPLLRCVRVFLDAKSPELVSIFKKALPNQKNDFLSVMQSLDPMDMNKYNEVMK